MSRIIVRVVILAIIAGLVLFGFIQLVPYGRNHTNPPVASEPNWNSPQTRQLAARACFDCHSNRTTWPWYSNVAPMSWLIERDVNEGRRTINFTNWNGQRQRVREAGETIVRGSMPPFYYIWLHPSGNLSLQEKQQLIQGLSATLGISPGSGDGGGEGVGGSWLPPHPFF